MCWDFIQKALIGMKMVTEVGLSIWVKRSARHGDVNGNGCQTLKGVLDFKDYIEQNSGLFEIDQEGRTVRIKLE